MPVYPLIFEPIFQRRIWGGRHLETLLNKRLPPGEPIGESWEISDLPAAPSQVANGPARGRTLGELVQEWGVELTGRAPLADGCFPLLIKFLDARQTLSVQVHPGREAAQRRGDARLKNEAWYVIEAEPDAFIYRGVREGVGEAELRQSLQNGTVESVLLKVPAKKGHAFYLPSGTIHALGAGIVVAEVQTPSDTTYRLYDWDRVDSATGEAGLKGANSPGKPRELHVEDALASAVYTPVAAAHERIEHVASVWTTVTRVIRCESFVIERVRMIEGVDQPIPYAEMVIWIVLEGGGRIHCDGIEGPVAFHVGNTVLLPAGLKNGRVITDSPTLWLEVTVPIESDLAGYERPPRGLPGRHSGANLVELNLPGPAGPLGH